MAKTKKHYDELLSAQVEKFTPEDVNYRDSENDREQCRKCIHYLVRRVDGFSLCEIVRPEDNDPIDPDYVCQFFTKDGEKFPLLK